INYLRENAWWMITELVEAINCSGWKTWTKDYPFDRARFMAEITDAQLFLDNLKLAALLPDQLPQELEAQFLDLTLKKIRQAVARKSSGYTGIRCPNCNEDKSLCECGYDWEAREKVQHG
ncbi:MAG: hypothetical protein ACRD8U_16000, partial [Pyrinomonadaceae bacterium]